jgi:hypothetical protein
VLRPLVQVAGVMLLKITDWDRYGLKTWIEAAKQSLPQSVIDALQGAGATEEMIAAAVGAFGDFGDSPPSRRGRPRKYRTRAECDRAYYERRKHHEKNHEENKDKTSQYEKTHEKTAPDGITGAPPRCGGGVGRS